MSLGQFLIVKLLFTFFLQVFHEASKYVRKACMKSPWNNSVNE